MEKGKNAGYQHWAPFAMFSKVFSFSLLKAGIERYRVNLHKIER